MRHLKIICLIIVLIYVVGRVGSIIGRNYSNTSTGDGRDLSTLRMLFAAREYGWVDLDNGETLWVLRIINTQKFELVNDTNTDVVTGTYYIAKVKSPPYVVDFKPDKVAFENTVLKHFKYAQKSGVRTVSLCNVLVNGSSVGTPKYKDNLSRAVLISDSSRYRKILRFFEPQRSTERCDTIQIGAL